MNTQTKNFIDLCKGGNPSTIQNLLRFQNSNVLKDLYEIYGTKDHGEISVKLSIG